MRYFTILMDIISGTNVVFGFAGARVSATNPATGEPFNQSAELCKLMSVSRYELFFQSQYRDVAEKQASLITIADSACGYAALTLRPREAAVLTTEFKINLLAPAKGDRLRAVGRVVRNGKTLVITLGEVFAESAGASKQIAMITATMMVVSTGTGLRD